MSLFILFNQTFHCGSLTCIDRLAAYHFLMLSHELIGFLSKSKLSLLLGQLSILHLLTKHFSETHKRDGHTIGIAFQFRDNGDLPGFAFPKVGFATRHLSVYLLELGEQSRPPFLLFVIR